MSASHGDDANRILLKRHSKLLLLPTYSKISYDDSELRGIISAPALGELWKQATNHGVDALEK